MILISSEFKIYLIAIMKLYIQNAFLNQGFSTAEA